MPLYGNLGYEQYFPQNGQSVQFPAHAPMGVMPSGGPFPEGALQLPHFTGDRLVIPPGQGLSLPASVSSVSGQMPAPQASSRRISLPRAVPTLKNVGGRSEDMEKLKDEIKQEIEEQQSRKEAKLESRWFELPSNTYGTAIWAVLILEMEALNPLFLFAAADSENVPSDQRWDPEAGGNWLVMWGRLRFSPFVVAVFFEFSCVALCLISWLVQFGFIYTLDVRIGSFTFFDLENAQYVCSTSGWVQLISVGFFLAFMMGQIPKVIKNIILITTGSSETDEARGEEGARTLCITDDQLSSATHQHKQRSIHEITAQTLINEAKSIPGILKAALPALEYIPRTPGSLRARRVISMIFPLAELFIIGYLIYVGVKYIFWSGFTSNEQGDPGHFPHFPEDAQDSWPWMSETQGVEEIIMATLAMQFVMDIDEGVFEYVLPKSVQNSVSNTKLSCFGWLPAQFRASDYIMIGKSMSVIKPEPNTPQYPLGYERYKVLSDMQKSNSKKMQDPVFLNYLQDAAASTISDCFEELEEWSNAHNSALNNEDKANWDEVKQDAKVYYTQLVDEVDWLLEYYKDYGYANPEDQLDHECCEIIRTKLNNVPPSQQSDYWSEKHEEITEEFYEALKARPLRLKWLNLLPDATFIFTLFVIVLPICIVFLVRAKMGCFNFGVVGYDQLPANLVGYWDGVERLIPLFVVFSILVGWRGFFLCKGIWRTSQEEQDDINEMKEKREARNAKRKANRKEGKQDGRLTSAGANET